MKKLRVTAAALCICAVAAAQAFACSTIIIGKKVSPTGYVIVGHNEDDGGRLTVRHGYVPAAEHKAGAVLPAEKDRAAIPQVSKTAAFYWSQVKGASGGMSNADAMLNEHGVLVVSNSCASSRQDTKDASRLTDGGIEYNLRRVIAERAVSARSGVDIAIEMIERWGYAPSGRTYTIADKEEAWMVQVVSGKHYVAVRVPDDEVAFMPNHYTVGEINPDDPNVIVSKDLVAYATEKGWYTPEDGAFNFARAYQAEKSYMREYNTLRQRVGLVILTGQFLMKDSLPFSVKPNKVIPVERVKAALRSHYEGSLFDTPWDRAQFPGGAPHDTTTRRICTGSTVESTVVTFAAQPLLTTVWTAFGRPCTLPYIPMHPLCGKLPAGLSPMTNPAKTLENHLLPDSEYAAWRDDAWQSMRDFESLFELVYQENFETHKRFLWSREHHLTAREQDVTARAAALLAQKKEAETKELLAKWDNDELNAAVTDLNNAQELLASVPVVTDPRVLSSAAPRSEMVVAFYLSGKVQPAPDTLLFGLGFANARTRWAAAVPGTLQYDGKGWWSCIVKTDLLWKSLESAKGTFDCWLGGRDTHGAAFGGRAFITVE